VRRRAEACASADEAEEGVGEEFGLLAFALLLLGQWVLGQHGCAGVSVKLRLRLSVRSLR
jgi:hypothetical protein